MRFLFILLLFTSLFSERPHSIVEEDGKVISYSEASEYYDKISEGYYKEPGSSIRHGHWIDYFVIGNKKLREGKFNNGVKEGIWTSYYFSQNKFAERHYENDKSYVINMWSDDGELLVKDGNGRMFFYYLQRNYVPYSIKMIGNYKNGMKSGKWFFYNKDESLQKEAYYEKNMKHGKWVTYSKEETFYNKDGTSYNKDGNFKSEEYYKNDGKIKDEFYVDEILERESFYEKQCSNHCKCSPKKAEHRLITKIYKDKKLMETYMYCVNLLDGYHCPGSYTLQPSLINPDSTWWCKSCGVLNYYSDVVNEDRFPPYDTAARPKIPLSDLIVYPESTREQGIEGKVFIKAFINEDGNVAAVKIIKSSGSLELDEAGIDAIIKSKWIPATEMNEKVGVWITIPVDFSLTN